MKHIKMGLLVVLVVGFCLPWYRYITDKPIYGWLVPWDQEVTLLFLLYVIPICAVWSFVRLLGGMEAGVSYFLAALPTLLFWILAHLQDLYLLEESKMFGAYVSIAASVGIIFTAFTSVHHLQTKVKAAEGNKETL